MRTINLYDSRKERVMESIYVFSSGNLKRKDNTIVLETDDGKKHIPVENVSEIRIFGEINLNKRLLEFLTKKGILIHFYNHEGYYVGTYYPRNSNWTGITFIKQVEHYLDERKRITIAKKIVEGSIKNMIAILKYYQARERNLEDKIELLNKQKENLTKFDTISQIMGIEGNARELYYSSFNEIINQEDFHFHKREKRPPTNYINTMISFGNSLLYTTVLSEIFKTHLDPRVGYLHESNQRRFSLNLDISEIFKPIIVDRVIFKLINRNQIDKKHFSTIVGGIKLNETGKKIFVKEFENTLKTTTYHQRLKRKVSYRTLLRLEAYKLEKHILGMSEYIPYKHKY